MKKNTILLDTHTWLWLLSEPAKFSPKTLRLVSNKETDLFLSVASIWEISIKSALGKLRLPHPVKEYLPEKMAALGVQELSIGGLHALTAGQLPNHHADPFDRLIIAQSMIEGFPVLGADKVFERYGVKLLPL